MNRRTFLAAPFIMAAVNAIPARFWGFLKPADSCYVYTETVDPILLDRFMAQTVEVYGSTMAREFLEPSQAILTMMEEKFSRVAQTDWMATLEGNL